MLHWALLFFILALVAGVLGFGGFVGGSLMLAAKACFVVFILLLVISIFTRGGPSVPSDPYGY